MTASALELAGMLAGCGAAGLALVARDRRLRLAALALALALAPVLVAGSVWNEPRVVRFRGDGEMVAVAALVIAAAIAAVAVLFRRVPVAFPVLALAVVPLRIPVEIGGETANLLIPLYVVIAGAAAAEVWAAWRERGARPARVGAGAPGAARPPGPAGGAGPVGWPPSDPMTWLRWLLAATLVLYAAQSAYSKDVSNAIEVAGFFLIPFAALFALLVEVDWTRRLLGLAIAAVAAMAALFAGVAIYQYAVRDLFFNDDLLSSNQLHQYFRVNSLFFDPNILGRYLALAVTGLAAYVAWSADRRRLAAAALLAGLALAGLALSFSITSFAALLAGLGTLALLRWRLPGGAAAGGMAAVAAVALLLAGGAPSSDLAGGRNLDSGRTDLVAGGLELAEERPLTGWGSGSFGAAFSERIERARTTVSHSEPVTVAAEQGALGLAVYLPLVLVSLLVLFAAGPGGSVGRSAVAAGFVVMLVHSVGYAGFAIDPATWALLALGVALRGG